MVVLADRSTSVKGKIVQEVLSRIQKEWEKLTKNATLYWVPFPETKGFQPPYLYKATGKDRLDTPKEYLKSKPRRHAFTPLKNTVRNVREIFESLSLSAKPRCRILYIVSDGFDTVSQKNQKATPAKYNPKIDQDIKGITAENCSFVEYVNLSKKTALRKPIDVINEAREYLKKECLEYNCLEYNPPNDGPTASNQNLEEDPFADVVAVGSRRGWKCSGILLDSLHVLTARHCLPATDVMVGNDIAFPEQRVSISSWRTPPALFIDLAVLLLSKPILVSMHERRPAKDTTDPSGSVRHIGFGARDSTGRYGFGVKHAVNFPLFGWGCDGARPRHTGCDPNTELIIPGGGGRDTCDGDSGGAVFENTGTVNNPIWRLIGITSRPLANARVRCGSGGIYVRVDRLEDWLRSVLVNC